MNRTEDSFVKKNKKSSISILPSSKSTASSTNLMLSSNKPRIINNNNIYDGFFNYNRIGLFLVILLLFIGIGIMLILGNTFDEFLMNLQNYFLSTFGLLGTSAGAIVNTSADVAGDAAKMGIDIVEDSLHDAGNLMAGNSGYATGNIDTGTIDTGNIDTGNIDTGNIDTGNIDTGNLIAENTTTPTDDTKYIDTDTGRYKVTDNGVYLDTDNPLPSATVVENYTTSDTNQRLNRRRSVNSNMNDFEGNITLRGTPRPNRRRPVNSNMNDVGKESRSRQMNKGGFYNNNQMQGNAYPQIMNNNYNRNYQYNEKPQYNRKSQYNRKPQYNGNVYIGGPNGNGNHFSKPHVFGNIVPAWSKSNSYYNPNSTAGNIQFNAWNHNHQPPSISKALNKQAKPFSNVQPDTSDDIIQKSIPSGKNNWCLIGEYKKKRGCVSVLEDDICMSGQLFPSKEMCLNPNIRNTE